jgi:hypothetical protein
MNTENEKEYLIPRDSELFKRLEARRLFAQERIELAMTDLEIRYWQGQREAIYDALNLKKEK